ncbi:MAG TPA: hypothetical protein VK771_03630, partial [Acidimicrobiia bacterium]|nr:hypothetical protein [Acidimicrobiia bacterium]
MSGSGAATAGPTLDNFVCYTATATTTAAVRVPFSGTPSKVSLTSNFPSGRFAAAPGALRLHCNPVQTTAQTLTTPVTNPNAHLVCDTISPTGPKLPLLVTLKNQFGTGEMRLTAAQSLCMPSWENDTTPAHFPTASTPPNLDGDVCYLAVHPTGTPSFVLPTSLQLKDQYTTRSTSVAAPNLVCVPSAITMNGNTTKLVNPTHS